MARTLVDTVSDFPSEDSDIQPILQEPSAPVDGRLSSNAEDGVLRPEFKREPGES